MNSIVTLKRLVELLSKASGKNMAYVDAYIRAFTDAVRSSVAAGEAVKVKGLGTFSVDPSTRAIIFEPDAELANAINEPFAMFTAEEVAPAVDNDIADPDFVFDINLPAPDPEPIPAPETEPIPEPAPTETPEPEPVPEIPVESGLSEVAPEPAPEPIAEPYPAPAPEPSDYYDYSDSSESESSFPVFWVIWSVVIGAVIGLLIGFLLHDPIMGLFEPSLKQSTEEVAAFEEPQTEQKIDTTASSQAEKTAETPNPETETAAAPATDAVVYDYVESTLSSLALKHYGNKNFWVYIYLENQDKISNPNRISPNLKVVIPPKEKYETGATEEEKIENAKRKANEIMQKFN